MAPRTRHAGVSVQMYLDQVESRGHARLFAKGVEYPAFDKQTSEPVEGSQRIGLGTGALYGLMRETGLMDELKAEGVNHLLFKNTEVFVNPALLYGAFLESGRNAGLVLVPVSGDFKGGSPFLRTGAGGQTRGIVSTDFAPEKLKGGNALFNSNTGFFPLDDAGELGVNYEEKPAYKDGPIVDRSKMDITGLTNFLSTAGLGGRQLHEFPQIKGWLELLKNCPVIVDLFQQQMSDLKALHQNANPALGYDIV